MWYYGFVSNNTQVGSVTALENTKK